MPASIVDLLDVRHPFTRADAISAGISPSALRGSNFRRIFRGVYVHISVASHPLVRVRAALLIHPPQAFASHVSAAHVYAVPVPDLPHEHVSVFEEKDRRRRPCLRNHVADPGAPVAVVKGVRVSAPAQMFVELAEVLALVDLVIVGDALVRLRRISPEELRDFCAQSKAPHARLARQAAGLVRKGVDSPMESRLRMLIVLAGLPEPTVNHKVYDKDGRLLYRFDLSYPELKLIVEYDGRQHREDLDQWDHDTDRRDWFDHNGWMIVPVFSRGIFKRPDKTLARVLAALKSRGCPDLPRRLAEDWRPHFPVKS